MAKNFNASPYYDDFNPSKNYHRILFKPGVAVQARELTQSQTILQNQISDFASSIYSQNTPISGGKITTNFNVSYLKLNIIYNNVSIVAADFLNKTITDASGLVVAKVVATAESTSTTTVAGDPPTLVLAYQSGQRFQDGMTIYVDGIDVATTIGVAGGVTCTGKSSVASVSPGVFWIMNGYNTVQNADGTTTSYQIGNFVNVNAQTTILDKYDSTPSLRVGLTITEAVVTSQQDSTLLDPAVSASNYQGPGADRYQINLSLGTRTLAIGNDEDFVELVRIVEGTVVKQTDDSVYSAIDDYFAKRDYETNGDYIVEDFKLTPKPSANGSLYYDMVVGPGVAYVHGYRVQNQSNLTLTTPRAQNTATVTASNNNTFINYGNYFYVDTANGFFDTGKMPQIDIHSVSAASINVMTANSYAATLVSSTLLKNLTYVSAPVPSNPSRNVYKAHVTDILTNTLTSNANAVMQTSFTGGNLLSQIAIQDYYFTLSDRANAYYGATLSITSGTGVGSTRTITNWNVSTGITGSTTKIASLDRPLLFQPDGTSNVSITLTAGVANSIVVRANTGGTGASASNVYTYSANANINIQNGKINGLSYNPAVLYSPTTPELIFPIGNSYVANNTVNNLNYYSRVWFRNVTLNNTTSRLQLDLTGIGNLYYQAGTGLPLTGDAARTLYSIVDLNTGQLVDMTSNTIIANSSTTIVWISSAPAGHPFLTHNFDVQASVYFNSATIPDTGGNIVKTKQLINANTSYVSGTILSAGAVANSGAITGTSSTFVDTNFGQTYITANVASNTTAAIYLYVSDVKSIAAIYDTGAPGAPIVPGGSIAGTGLRNITSSYAFNNGQKDNLYDYASIQLQPGAAPPIGNILVCYNYYAHSGGDGFFAGASSYLTSNSPETYTGIPSYTTKRGTLYNLRDCLDFRPTRLAGQNINNYVWEYHRDPNTVSTGGIFIPQDTSNINSGYQYYLSRKDKLVLTKDGKFLMILGAPAINSIYPIEPSGSLVLANIALDAYTAYVPGEGSNVVQGQFGNINISSVPVNLSVNKILHKRWSKKDISDLQKQVDNLEYYAALSLLETNANSLQVPDVFGLNRFKNGILVDDFTSFATADNKSFADFHTNINIRKKTMGSITNINNFQLQNDAIIQGLGTLTAHPAGYAISSIRGGSTNLYTLPYTVANLVVQQYASNTISVNPFSVVNYAGSAQLNPPMDNWVNTYEGAAITITDPQYQFTQTAGGVTLTNAGDFHSIVGTTVATPTLPAATSSQQYASQSSGLSNAIGASSAAPTPLSAQNGYVTNTGAQAFIRPQEVIVRAQGLLKNSILNCYFDGVKVNQYIQQPHTIELNGVNGRFLNDDVVGFYSTSTQQFYPLGRVIYSYVYPTNNQTRLYISDYIQMPNTVTNTIQVINANFAANGKYIGSTASGNIAFGNAIGANLISIHTSGTVSGVSGQFTSGNTAVPASVYKSEPIASASSLINNYGIWGDPSGVKNVNYNFKLNSFAGVSLVRANSAYGIVYSHSGLNAGSFITFGYYYNGVAVPVSNTAVARNYTTTSTISIPSTWTTSAANAANAYITMAITAPTDMTAAIGVTVNDANNSVVWDTLSVGTLTPGLGANVTVQIPMDPVGQGGTFYSGVTQFNLSSSASTANQYYQGAQIQIASTYVYKYNYSSQYIPPPPDIATSVTHRSPDGDSSWTETIYSPDYATLAKNAALKAQQQASVAYVSRIYRETANITDYYAPTRTVTLDKPVDISIGNNSQYGPVTSQYNINGNQLTVAGAVKGGNTVPAISTDELGNFAAIFNIPGSQFYQGQRVFRVDNSLNDDPGTATTYAEATFYAGGIQGQTSTGSATVDAGTGTIKSVSSQQVSIASNPSLVDPIAQTFIIDKKNYPNGAFLSDIKLFFAPFQTNTAVSAPVTVSVCETLNGVPNGSVLDHSVVTLQSDQINHSANPYYKSSNTYTQFSFEAPVYIQSGVLYAFIISSPSPDYLLYTAKQNQPAITSSAGGVVSRIGSQPYTGALFESQNGQTWTADNTQDLMFVIENCVFNTTNKPQIAFSIPKGLPTRKLGKQAVKNKYDTQIVNNVYGTAIQPTQAVHAFNVTTTDFTPTQTGISYAYQATLAKDLSTFPVTPSSVTPGRFGTPTQDNIYFNDTNGSRILFKDSATSFQMFATLASTDPYVSPVLSDDGLTVFTAQHMINNMGILPNKVQVANSGTGYSNNGTIVITSGLYKSNTLNDLGNNDLPVFQYTTNAITGGINTIFTTYPGSGYIVNPTITISDPATRQTGNANAVLTIVGETGSYGGNGTARYYTKKVVMTPGNDSGDLRVFYTAYKPPGSQVYVYYRILNANDNTPLESQNWQLMAQVGGAGVFSNSGDRTNLIEYQCAPGNFLAGTANNAVAYTSPSGVTYSGPNAFIQFGIKVVLAAADPTNPPFLTDIRALALPIGTGI
jgi:hypothetical protein